MFNHFVQIDGEGLGVEDGFEELGGGMLVFLVAVVCLEWQMGLL